jgi:Ohr subfamily peroxiredoxin
MNSMASAQVGTMNALYSTVVTAIGGRSGTVKSDDGLLEIRLAMPNGLGGKGGATNPEQLFAAGYAACFGNAVIHVTRNKDRAIKDEDVEVAATVGLTPNGSGGFALVVALNVILTGVDQATAEAIVEQAHQVCPYSNATRGNIDVALSVKTR